MPQPGKKTTVPSVNKAFWISEFSLLVFGLFCSTLVTISSSRENWNRCDLSSSTGWNDPLLRKTKARRATFDIRQVYLQRTRGKCRLSAGSQAVDDGSAPQALDILFGLVQAGLLHCLGGWTLHQLDKIMTVNFVHDAKHSAAVVTYPLQVLAFAGEGLSCRWEGAIKAVGQIHWRRVIRCTTSHLIYRRCLWSKAGQNNNEGAAYLQLLTQQNYNEICF